MYVFVFFFFWGINIIRIKGEDIKTKNSERKGEKFWCCLRLEFNDVTVHEHCFNVIWHCCNRTRRWLGLWKKVFYRLFNFKLQTESYLRALQEEDHSDSDREESSEESDVNVRLEN